MAKLDTLLPAMYRKMHAEGAFLGEAWRHHEALVKEFFTEDDAPVLDFGCGPLGGLAALYGPDVIPYDPYVARYAADPWGRNPRGFFSCDVLEHLPLHRLRALVDQVCEAESVRKVFLTVSARAANKTMPNGLNAHLTVRPALWWDGFLDFRLGQHFDRVIGRYDMERVECVFAFTRRAHAHP